MKRTEKRAHSNKLHRSSLSFRIALITILSSLFSLLAIELNYINNKSVISDYESILNEEYTDLEYINKIMICIYNHEANMFHYMVENDSLKRNEIANQNKAVEGELNRVLKDYEANVRGGDYESGYHDMYSKVSGYLKNVHMVLNFADSDDFRTANYYMRSVLIPYISDLDSMVMRMNQTLIDNVKSKKSDMKSNVELTRIVVRAVLFLLVLAAVFNVAYCVRISNEMMRRDMLTGVYNFDYLIQCGEKMDRKRSRYRLTDYVGLALSIKDFKFINQDYGSNIGDLVLSGYATKLNEKMLRGEVLARNGGDNFVALVEKSRVDDFLGNIEKIPVEVGSSKMGLNLTTRCGIYQITEYDTIYDVINAATLALSETRVPGAKDYVWFRKESRDEMIRQKDILNGYNRAIAEEEFVVYYQPKINLKTRTLCGCEALVRWIRNGELIPPNSFIPVLENDGKVQELDFYVFDRVCKDIGDWQRRGLQPVRVSSNFSKLHLHNKDFANDVLAIVDKYGADPYYLEAELTESSGYEDFDALTHFVAEMREAGINTSMDDFGTGYSSLSLLRDIDMDVIKLDRTFLRDERDEKEEKMVENIVRMIHDLNRHVLCEGVETEEQAEFLLRVGCTMAQGFMFDRPLSKEDFEKRLINPYYS